IALLVDDEAPLRRELQVVACLRILVQPLLIALVGGQAVETADDPPADIVRALPGQEVADQGGAAARNDPAPPGGIFLERIALIGIDLISDDADDGHLLASGFVRLCGCGRRTPRLEALRCKEARGRDCGAARHELTPRQSAAVS